MVRTRLILGGIKVGTNLNATNDGTLSAVGYVYNDIKKSIATGSGTASGQYSHAEGYDTHSSNYGS